MAEIWLSGPAYRLGGARVACTDLPGLAEALADRKLPDDPDMLGLGAFHRIETLYDDIAHATGRSVAKAGLAGGDIDGVIFTSSRFHDDASAQNKGYARALIANDIAPKTLMCLSGTGCVSVVTGIALARALIADKGLANVLVVNIDFLEEPDDLRRLCPHAFLSDAVALVVVSPAPRGDRALRVTAIAEKTDVVKMRDGVQIRDFALGRDVVAGCLGDAGQTVAGLDKLLSNNIFRPLKKIKEDALGFAERQMFLENIVPNGHCYASDLLINLSDYLDGVAEPGGVLLYSEADGHTGCVLALPG